MDEDKFVMVKESGFFEKNKAYLIAGGVVLLALFGWYLFGVYCDISDNRARVDAVTKQLDQTGKELQNTASGLQRVEQTIDRGIGTVNRTETIVREVQVRANNDATIINESAKLIDDSQRIIQTIRQRGTTEAK